jgi:hypothetical protein
VPLAPDSARMAIAREAGRRFCPVAVNAVLAARLEKLAVTTDEADLDIRSDSPARVGSERVSSRFTPDYRFVTTS